MSWLGRALRFGDHAALWRLVAPRGRPAGGAWFLSRFLDASSVVVRRWGPRWGRRHRVLGRELGAWLLAVLWLGVPVVMVVRAARRLLH
jgi:hypothetical protein